MIQARWTKGQNQPPYNLRGWEVECLAASFAAAPLGSGGSDVSTLAILCDFGCDAVIGKIWN